MRILLLNPNTNTATTAAMVALARQEAGARAEISGATAEFGEPLITNETALATAAEAVSNLMAAIDLSAYDAVIVAAFGDPGLAAVRQRIAIPAVGIAEAGMMEASAGERPFSVVTTTPNLSESIAAATKRYGVDSLYRGIRLTHGDPVVVMADAEGLVEALTEAARLAVEIDGARAILVGGGPLAVAARTLAGRGFSVPIVEPVPAAVRRALHLTARRG